MQQKANRHSTRALALAHTRSQTGSQTLCAAVAVAKTARRCRAEGGKRTALSGQAAGQCLAYRRRARANTLACGLFPSGDGSRPPSRYFPSVRHRWAGRPTDASHTHARADTHRRTQMHTVLSGGPGDQKWSSEFMGRGAARHFATFRAARVFVEMRLLPLIV